MRHARAMGFTLALSLVPTAIAAAPADNGEARFRALYKELIETDTSLSNGDCTLAANRMRDHLIAGGYPETQFRTIVPEGFPKSGNLVGQLTGSNPKLPAVLLMAHIDVVEAKRSDWQRDPFKLVEEDGYFYGRGAIDDKAMAASYVDALIRLRESRFKPKRTIKLALTCGEESPGHFDGARYLTANLPEAMKAGWAINEGGRGALDDDGKMISFGVQAGEKAY